jgi:hypothetical protein
VQPSTAENFKVKTLKLLAEISAMEQLTAAATMPNKSFKRTGYRCAFYNISGRRCSVL